jgi:transmembrane sensor
MNQPVNKLLIQKYLRGECTADELQVMDNFLKREDAQRLIHEALMDEWDAFQEQDLSDEEISGWKTRFEERCLSEPLPAIKKLPLRKRFFSIPYAAVWAGLLLCFGTWYGITTYNRQPAPIQTIAMLESKNPMGQRSKIVLPDSSTVYLAGGSKLIYPQRFSAGKREVALQGEAFFEITKNPKKPFIIRTGNVQTRVLGTSFLINAFKGQPMKVEVATGKVRVDQVLPAAAKSLAVLKPGQSLKWDDQNIILGTVAVDDLKEWKNGRLVFNGATFKEITTVLERCYNVRVTFKNAVKAARHITITLTTSVPINQIMEVLAGTGGFEYQLRGNQIIIN